MVFYIWNLIVLKLLNFLINYKGFEFLGFILIGYYFFNGVIVFVIIYLIGELFVFWRLYILVFYLFKMWVGSFYESISYKMGLELM